MLPWIGATIQDLQTFHEIAAQIIESDPGTCLNINNNLLTDNNDLELRQSAEIEEFERHSDDSDREYRGPRPGKFMIPIISNALPSIPVFIIQQ
jgi:hypothetical protein